MKDFDWQILATLYSARSITKTAELLFTSQPNVSKRLHIMEEELSTRIVTRSAKGAVLTLQGEYLASRAKEIVRLTEEIKSHINEMDNSFKGIIKLAAPNSFVRNALPGILERYQHNNQVNIQLVTCISDEIPKLLNNNEIDIGFLHGNHDIKGEKYLYSTEILYIVSTDEIATEDLPSLPQIEYTRSSSTTKIINDWWHEHYSQPPNIVLKVNHGDICREIIKKGLGYGLFFGNDFIDNGSKLCKAVAMKDGNTPVTRETWMIYTKQSYKRPIIKDFVEFIRNSR